MKVNLALEKFKDGASPGGLGSLEAPSTHVHRRSQSTVPISSASGSLQLTLTGNPPASIGLLFFAYAAPAVVHVRVNAFQSHKTVCTTKAASECGESCLVSPQG